MKITIAAVGLVLILASGNHAQNVVLDHVTGQISSGVLPVGSPVTFHFRINNTTAYNISGSTNGIRIRSTNGAIWSGLSASWNSGMQTNYYDGGVFVNIYSGDGLLADTIGFGGFRMTKPGIPAAYNSTVFSITATFDPTDLGKSITLDSCFYLPSNAWMWVLSGGGGTVVPSWGGPYTFTFSNTMCGDVNGSGAINILDVTHLIGFLYKSGAPPNCTMPVIEEGND